MTNEKHVNLAVYVALLAGKILIENGSNMERVNDTMNWIAKNAGLKNFQAFTTLTGMVASASNQTSTQVTAINRRANDLTKVADVNELSREFGSDQITLRQMRRQLEIIRFRNDTTPVWLQCLAAAILSISLMVVFTGDRQDLAPAFIIGGFSYAVYLLINQHFTIKYIGEFVSSLVIAILAILSVRLGLAHQADHIIIGAVMSLVPGVPLTNAARDLVSGNLISGLTRAIEAIITAAAIGCAIVIIIRLM